MPRAAAGAGARGAGQSRPHPVSGAGGQRAGSGGARSGGRRLRCAGRYREASAEVMEVLSRFAAIERASIDEAYLDLTGSVRERLRELRGRPLEAELLPTTFVQGLPAGPGPRPADKGTRGSAPMAPRGSRCRAGASRGAALPSRRVPSRCAAGAEGGDASSPLEARRWKWELRAPAAYSS